MRGSNSHLRRHSRLGLLALLLLAGCVPQAARPTPTITPSSTPSPTATPQDTLPGQRPGVLIQSPREGDKVTSPVVVQGLVRTFECHVVVVVLDQRGGELPLLDEQGKRLLNEQGNEIRQSSTTGRCQDVGIAGSFSITLAFEPPSTPQPGAIEARDYSAKDGHLEVSHRVSVTLMPK